MSLYTILDQTKPFPSIKVNSLTSNTFYATDLSCDKLTIKTDDGIVALGNLNLDCGPGSIIELKEETHTPELVITSIDGIISDSTDLNITANPTNNINLSVTNGVIHNQGPVTFQNPFTTISTTSQFTGYSTGTFALNFSGNCVNAVTGVIIKYVRIGSQVTLQFPNLTFVKNNGTASQIISSPIPVDLQPVLTDYYMQLTAVEDEPLTALAVGIIEYDDLIKGIRLSKNDNFSSFSQAAAPNEVLLSACSLVYIL
jgi:hypothetical protein